MHGKGEELRLCEESGDPQLVCLLHVLIELDAWRCDSLHSIVANRARG